ncbi:organic cation transporter protein isoform X2 [Anabrus simplex]|uniref:organic cation transporter protein isoform X2 n=1 Tax=Anabrus simplex TaxID=316456 RepID=UPI0035A2B845
MNQEVKDVTPPVDDGLEKALDEIGCLSRWMWAVFFMASIPGIFNIWALTSYVFIGAELEHWCYVPELKATNWTDEQIRIIITGSKTGKSCSAPAYNYSQLAEMSFDDALQEVTDNPTSVSWQCVKFDYKDEGTSIVSEWNLVCDRLFLRSTVQMVVSFGKFVGALLFGIVADKWGRKMSFVISCGIYIIIGPVTAVISNYWLFLLCRFALGMAGSGCFNCGFTLVMEILNVRYRSTIGILYNMSYPVGMLLLPLIAYFIRQWRTLMLSLTVPAVLLLISCWFLPESPRWLMSHGRRKDAWSVVQRANKMLGRRHTMPPATGDTNTSTKDPVPMSSTAEEIPEPVMKKFIASMRVMGSLLTKCELLKRLLICYYLWFVTSMTYYALSLSSDNFTANRYIYIAGAGAAEAVSYVLPIPILRFLGRRPTSFILYLMTGIALLSVLAVPYEYPMAIMTVALLGRLCIGAVYSVIILYTSELFPTVNRNTAIGSSSMISHAGSMSSPYLVDLLGAVQWFIPSTICAGCSLAGGLLVLLLPETRGKELCNTIEETEARAKKGDKVTMKNCLSC